MNLLKPITTRYSLEARLYALAFLVSMANWALLGVFATPDTPGYIDPTVSLVAAGIYGERLSSGEFWPSAYRTPGTSLIMLPFYFFSRDVGTTFFLTTLLFSALAPLLSLFAFQLGKVISPVAAYVGYTLMLLHANMHFSAVSIMSDLPFAAFFSLGNIILIRALKLQEFNWKHSLALGFTCGAAGLIRPTGIYWAFGALVILLFISRQPMRKRLQAITMAALMTAAVVSPWLIRNAVTLGAPTMETIKGHALLWSLGPTVTPDSDDVPKVTRVKEIILMYPDNRMMYHFHGGHDYTIKNQVDVSALLQQIALEEIQKAPRTFLKVWAQNVINLFQSQTHYERWLNHLHASPRYQAAVPHLKRIVPRIETKLYHMNLELHRIAIVSIKYLALPGLLLLIFMRPFIGALQIWNILVICGLTAIVSGYDRFRLPIDPVLSACSGLTIAFLLYLPKRLYDLYTGTPAQYTKLPPA